MGIVVFAVAGLDAVVRIRCDWISMDGLVIKHCPWLHVAAVGQCFYIWCILFLSLCVFFVADDRKRILWYVDGE